MMEIYFESLTGDAFNNLYAYIKSRRDEKDSNDFPTIELKGVEKLVVGANDLIYEGIRVLVKDKTFLPEVVNTLKGLSKALAKAEDFRSVQSLLHHKV